MFAIVIGFRIHRLVDIFVIFDCLKLAWSLDISGADNFSVFLGEKAGTLVKFI